ncbi:Rpn family recombination-promoting nuclease/putative transposase [Azotobacter vinelandii]|uniref:Rpn family recombination-promoting nuclease/putative transposase n=1 Tax=Azotobacter vinelandii TaxID=354 RepID=UPI00091777E2|nr:Rpn family recombination-promoting nuclease/putative transposase [Azotobacter vinelandii]WKN23182.1 Rpn family recombination-promoting nuclease/putative transposase [Azotobacter vinelandii]SFY09192.1 conserved hypothetical protein (putative transposase or invertase) [Azotobacter vinelandii]
MAQHDNAYKLLFSHPDMVQDLLQGFVPEDWVTHLDFSTLEKVNGNYVSEDLLNRVDDIVWRLRLNGEWLYVYLLLEFQSRNDRWMALRLMTYIGLLYQELVASGQIQSKRLPPVFPIVIYNGESRWTASREVADLIAAPLGSLAAYRPRLSYFLLDEKRLGEQELTDDHNLVTGLVKLESSQSPQSLRAMVAQLRQRLQAPQYDSLRRAFAVWIRRVILDLKSKGDHIPDICTLEEIDTMLAERAGQWADDWMQQGMQKGMQQGQVKLLARLIERRFGPLTPAHQQLLADANEAQLEAWADAVLTAQTLDELFALH